MYFIKNISENKDGKKIKGSYLSCVANGEFYFSWTSLCKPRFWRQGLEVLNSSDWNLPLLPRRQSWHFPGTFPIFKSRDLQGLQVLLSWDFPGRPGTFVLKKKMYLFLHILHIFFLFCHIFFYTELCFFINLMNSVCMKQKQASKNLVL